MIILKQDKTIQIYSTNGINMQPTHHIINCKIMSPHYKENVWEMIISLISPCDVTDNESALPTGQLEALRWQPSLHMGLPVERWPTMWV